MSLLRSEWIKLFSTRTTWAMIGVGLLIEALFAGLYVGLTPLESLDGVGRIAAGTELLLTLMLVLGVLVITTEFRHGTASSTFLASPKRYPAMLAKLGLVLVTGVIVGLVFALVNSGLALPILSQRGVPLPPSGEIVDFYAGGIAAIALTCAMGLGIGAIARNQVGAIVAALVFVFILSHLPELAYHPLADYFPTKAIGSLQGLHKADEESVGQLAGALVLLAWAAGMFLLGTVLVCRRDVAE